MFKYAKQNSCELSGEAPAVLLKHGISRVPYNRSAPETAAAGRAENSAAQIIKSDAPKKQYRETIKTLQDRYRHIIGSDYKSVTEEEKKAFFDDLSGDL